MSGSYDVIIIGAGSVGVPTAFFLAKAGLSVLVLDKRFAPGQGENKAAIGGIRAAHYEPAKIILARTSREIFANFEKEYGIHIEWHRGGYLFLAYDEQTKTSLLETVEVQKNYLNEMQWVSPEEIKEIVPSIHLDGIIGGVYSPKDGYASPLLAIEGFYMLAKSYGANFHFGEEVTSIEKSNSKIISVTTTKNKYSSAWVINAAGADAKEIGKMIGLELPIYPESHEGGISTPIKRFLEPLIVDLKSTPGAKNFYFYQALTGQIIFCLTPDPPIPGKDKRSTSSFLPIIARRMISLIPKLKELPIRRTWRGLYPMTPDGSPIIGIPEGFTNYINAVGMCGQGFMLGPGIAKLITRLITNTLTEEDKQVLDELKLERSFKKEEILK